MNIRQLELQLYSKCEYFKYFLLMTQIKVSLCYYILTDG